jgi:hypothetical protein
VKNHVLTAGNGDIKNIDHGSKLPILGQKGYIKKRPHFLLFSRDLYPYAEVS